VDEILIFAVLKRWLLQRKETEASFVYKIYLFIRITPQIDYYYKSVA